MGKVSKESVNYRHGTSERHCGNCVMFRLHPPDFESGACTLVQGIIEEDDVCDRWEGEVSKADPEMDMIQLTKMADQYNWMSIKMDELMGVDPQAANAYAATIWQIKIEAFPMMVKLFDAGYEVNPHDFGWNIEQLVLEPMRKWLCKSEETPYLSSHHAPIGHEGLWHTPNKKHPKKEQLPAYIQNVRNALMRAGHGEQEAHAMAIGAVKRWATGRGAWGHKGKVTPVVREAAQKAVEEWERLKAEHSG
jgi:hypothetical protein